MKQIFGGISIFHLKVYDAKFGPLLKEGDIVFLIIVKQVPLVFVMIDYSFVAYLNNGSFP